MSAHDLHWVEENGRGSISHELPDYTDFDDDRDPAACTCVPASAYFPAEPDETCPRHRSYDPEEG